MDDMKVSRLKGIKPTQDTPIGDARSGPIYPWCAKLDRTPPPGWASLFYDCRLRYPELPGLRAAPAGPGRPGENLILIGDSICFEAAEAQVNKYVEAIDAFIEDTNSRYGAQSPQLDSEQERKRLTEKFKNR